MNKSGPQPSYLFVEITLPALFGILYMNFNILESSTIQKVNVLTDSDRPKVLIIDDSMFDQNMQKKELRS